MNFTCETCGQPFRRVQRQDRPNLYCSLDCIPRKPPSDEPDFSNWQVERAVVKVARRFASEHSARFLDLFTGERATWARRCVYKRVRRGAPHLDSRKVTKAVQAVLVPEVAA